MRIEIQYFNENKELLSQDFIQNISPEKLLNLITLLHSNLFCYLMQVVDDETSKILTTVSSDDLILELNTNSLKESSEFLDYIESKDSDKLNAALCLPTKNKTSISYQYITFKNKEDEYNVDSSDCPPFYIEGKNLYKDQEDFNVALEDIDKLYTTEYIDKKLFIFMKRD